MSDVQRQKSIQTICWDCANAVGLCPWSHDFKPVKGWTVIPTRIKSAGNAESYIVIDCPCFDPDAAGHGQRWLKKGNYHEKQ